MPCSVVLKSQAWQRLVKKYEEGAKRSDGEMLQSKRNLAHEPTNQLLKRARVMSLKLLSTFVEMPLETERMCVPRM